MSFKSLLVFADDSDASARRVDNAIALAAQFDGALTAVALAEQPAYYYGIGTEVAADVYAEDVERAKALARQVAEATEAQLAKGGHDGGVRWSTGTLAIVAEIAARHARYADLAFIGQPFDSPQQPLMTKVFEGVLFDSGRPFIMLPRDWTPGPVGKHIMIAWAPRREAARAVADAMPLIEAAETVHVAMVDPDIGEDAHGEEPGADLARALARHDVAVSVDALPSAGQGVAGRLLTHAADCNADLIVMGGYGHWRLRQTLFGGVTRDIVRDTALPLLLAH
jgi:nucleotide-binding universal stress UspA family protein